MLLASAAMKWAVRSIPSTTSSDPAIARVTFRPSKGPDSTFQKTSAIGLAFTLAALVLAVLVLSRRNLHARATANIHRPVPNMAGAVVVDRRGLHVPPGTPPPDPRPEVHLGQVMVEDRKSTRLNSSHVKISYAVLCLKKKNTAIECRARRPELA